MESAMREFLSDNNLALHHLYMKNLYLKYSILQKSENSLNGLSLEDISRMSISRDKKTEAYTLLTNIDSHKCYFNSFTHNTDRCDNLRKFFGSEEKVKYEIFDLAKESRAEFIYIYAFRGKPEIKESEYFNAFRKCRPILALDLCEHAYFLDYGFDRERYLKAAISCLNLQKLDKLLTMS